MSTDVLKSRVEQDTTLLNQACQQLKKDTSLVMAKDCIRDALVQWKEFFIDVYYYLEGLFF